MKEATRFDVAALQIFMVRVNLNLGTIEDRTIFLKDFGDAERFEVARRVTSLRWSKFAREESDRLFATVVKLIDYSAKLEG